MTILQRCWHDWDKLDYLQEKFARDIEASGRYKPSGEISHDLGKLGFLQDGHLTRAAELLFGNHHTAIHLGRFKSRHTIVDDLVIRAPLILAVDEAMEFMKRNMRLGYAFTGELKRKETWQYPLPVLRELLLNAIVHKDYRDPTDVIIKMFDEHVEFTNPGERFGPLKLESLQTDFYRASHRNKLLAEAFYRAFFRKPVCIRCFLSMKYHTSELTFQCILALKLTSSGRRTAAIGPLKSSIAAPRN